MVKIGASLPLASQFTSKPLLRGSPTPCQQRVACPSFSIGLPSPALRDDSDVHKSKNRSFLLDPLGHNSVSAELKLFSPSCSRITLPSSIPKSLTRKEAAAFKPISRLQGGSIEHPCLGGRTIPSTNQSHTSTPVAYLCMLSSSGAGSSFESQSGNSP